ncbi:hypothetical protein CFE70_003515 [Pyrenophora teres f. teres 0-1]
MVLLVSYRPGGERADSTSVKQHAARSTQHAARSTQHAARSTQHAARSTQHTDADVDAEADMRSNQMQRANMAPEQHHTLPSSRPRTVFAYPTRRSSRRCSILVSERCPAAAERGKFDTPQRAARARSTLERALGRPSSYTMAFCFALLSHAPSPSAILENFRPAIIGLEAHYSPYATRRR